MLFAKRNLYPYELDTKKTQNLFQVLLRGNFSIDKENQQTRDKVVGRNFNILFQWPKIYIDMNRSKVRGLTMDIQI